MPTTVGKNRKDDQSSADLSVERPAKRAKLLDDSSSESDKEEEWDGMSSDGENGSVSLKINEEYARKFEHNKKREERQRLEEKYGKANSKNDSTASNEDDSSESESEDDEGLLATEDLDAEISATLQAIRSKDPRVYDKKTTFYSEFDAEELEKSNGIKKEKPMTLRDYHTKNLLEGKINVDEDDDAPLKTYAQEQETVRHDIVKEMHAAAEASDDEGGDFLVRKSKPEPAKESDGFSKKPKPKVSDLDVESADKDPETFLSNFMAARAWLPTEASRFQPFESDDEEEEERAENFEAAYNMRFEDPATANEKLMTHARDTAAKYSVRREEPSSRRKTRDAERAKREAEKAERQEEKARLKKLKVEEMEEKVKRIRKTAGLSGKSFKMEEWTDVLDADWDDHQWDEEMRKRFGEPYYQAGEADTGSDSDDQVKRKSRKKIRKPKWDDDIDIKDLVPDFDDSEIVNPAFTLSDDGSEDDAEPEDGASSEHDDDKNSVNASKSKSKQKKKDRLAARADAKRNARRDRRLIESLVDQNLDISLSLPGSSKSKTPTRFRYRETSPTTFGLTPRDILLASDSQLNQFAGLKKMAAFRDPEKKRKDKKNLSKKARLRMWRLETFGDENGPQGGFEKLIGEAGDQNDTAQDKASEDTDVHQNKKRKRSKKRKAESLEA
ncbi:Krr1-domain-containing protein [Glonium stellatum]|uniref:Krr1-domain-containing protein n=1 Tax=Glonium stellatum TaxID=574774 RepID=A0A8E2F5B9_9PEZI|nr:Krr1-domain-containing protein [Glonium stellatum]